MNAINEGRPGGPRIPRRSDTGANLGTLDPNVIPLLRGAMRVGELASEPAHYQQGYKAGWRAGVAHALFFGVLLGGALVALCIQLGHRAGG